MGSDVSALKKSPGAEKFSLDSLAGPVGFKSQITEREELGRP
jgi:hypothetical protein